MAVSYYQQHRPREASITVSLTPDFSGDYVCSGAADEVDINAAIVEIAALGGGEVVLGYGEFQLAATVNVPANVFLRGMGWETVLNYDAGGNCITITGDNVKIRDLKIVIVAGAGAATTRPNCIYANTRTNVEITKVWTIGDETEADDGSDFRQCGVVFYTVTFSRISLIRSNDHMRHGIIITTSSEGNTVSGCICQGNTLYGIYLSATSTDNTVIGNTCQGNVRYGIFLWSTGDDNTITGNTCQGNGYSGIGLAEGSDDNTVTGNTCQGNTLSGISLLVSSGCTISGNTCFQNVWHGIHLDTVSNNNTIVGNSCNENDSGDAGSYDGICIEDDCDYNIVHSNTCNLNDRWGISIGIGADDCVGNWVKNNHLRGNTSGAFSDQGTDTKVHEIHETVENPNSFIGRHPAEQMLDNVETTVRMGFSLPLEFQQIVTAQVVIVAATAGDLRWDALTDFGKLCSTEEYNEHNDAVGATTTAVLIDDLTCIDVSAALTDVAPGDRIGLEFWRDGDDDLDTIGDTVYVLEIRIRYV